MAEKKTEEHLPVKAEAVEAEAMPLAPPVAFHAGELAQRAREQLKARADMLKMVLQPEFVGRGGFQPFGDKIHITGPAAERIARVFRLQVEPNRDDKDDIKFKKVERKDGHYEIFIEGRVWPVDHPEESFSTMGSATTWDTMFTRGGKQLPLEAISEGTVKKKCLTNFTARGVQAFLGLRGLTEKELLDQGHKLREEDRVTYRKRGEGKLPPSPRPPAQDGETPDDEEIKQRIRGMLMTMHAWKKGDPQTPELIDACKGEIEVMSRFTDKKTGEVLFVESLIDPKLTSKWLYVLYGTCKKAFAEWEEKKAAAAEPREGEFNFPDEEASF